MATESQMVLRSACIEVRILATPTVNSIGGHTFRGPDGSLPALALITAGVIVMNLLSKSTSRHAGKGT
jgi:hypothetical protein